MSDRNTLSITIKDDGSLSINGPLDDKMTCYALIGCLQEAVRDFKKPEPKIQPPSPDDIAALTRRRPE